MQKVGILNSSISKVLADMGHTDKITVGDCGLPVPSDIQKIDLALKLGEPKFIDVVSEIAKYMEIEKVYVANEIKTKNPDQWNALRKLFPEDRYTWVILETHEEFKQLTKHSKAVVRTGEITPFSNIILESGVIF